MVDVRIAKSYVANLYPKFQVTLLGRITVQIRARAEYKLVALPLHSPPRSFEYSIYVKRVLLAGQISHITLELHW